MQGVVEIGLRPEIHLVTWSPDAMEHRRIDDVETLRRPPPEGAFSWVDVRGLGDESVLRRIAEIFSIEPLALEDGVNVPQRAKVQDHPEHLQVVVRIPCIEEDGRVATPQVCFLVGPRHLISF